jgi:hypothetical protein
MTTIYKLQDFSNIMFAGFDYTIPEETLKLISNISMQVGSPSYIKTPIFQKKTNNMNNEMDNHLKMMGNKKRRGQKHMEITGDEWESIRTFQSTKIEQKTGTDGLINQLRLFLNKLTDKTFLQIHSEIINIIESLIKDQTSEQEMTKIGEAIFEIASTNKFYSRLYADLYAGLINQYKFLRPVFDYNYSSYLNIFKNIEIGDPEKDYDKFCEINKNNEKRKAVSAFFVNLMLNEIVTQESIVTLLHTMLSNVVEYVQQENKKNEVDELTENIAILFNKEMLEKIYKENNSNSASFMINSETIIQVVLKLAKSKSKDYKSLSNKSIFKYMDLVEM